MKCKNMPERKRIRRAVALGLLIHRGEPKGIDRLDERRKAYYHELSALDAATQSGRLDVRTKKSRISKSMGRIK